VLRHCAQRFGFNEQSEVEGAFLRGEDKGQEASEENHWFASGASIAQAAQREP
jgi:hypothetical protein